MPAGTNTYALKIAYGQTIDPASFSATVNGKNIRHLFSPVPGGAETVVIPLRVPENLLELNVAGTADVRPKAASQQGLLSRTVPASSIHLPPVDTDKLKFHIDVSANPAVAVP